MEIKIEYNKLTNILVEQLNKASELNYKSWVKVTGGQVPSNYITKKPYQGVNKFSLMLEKIFVGYKTAYYLTFKQAREKGLQILKGEKASDIINYQPYYYNKEEKKRISIEEYNSLVKKMDIIFMLV